MELLTTTFLLYSDTDVVSLPIFIIADILLSKLLFLKAYKSPILLRDISTTSIPIFSSTPKTE